MAIMPRPFTRLENGPCGDRHGRQRKELASACDNGPRGHDSRQEMHEMKEEKVGILTVDETKAATDQRWLAARNGGRQAPTNISGAT